MQAVDFHNSKSKITNILNSEENLKRKVPNQMVKSNNETHQTNGQQLSYSGFDNERNMTDIVLF